MVNHHQIVSLRGRPAGPTGPESYRYAGIRLILAQIFLSLLSLSDRLDFGIQRLPWNRNEHKYCQEHQRAGEVLGRFLDASRAAGGRSNA